MGLTPFNKCRSGNFRSTKRFLNDSAHNMNCEPECGISFNKT